MSEKLNKTLAIIGHPTRGKEVIQILEMLRGKNKWLYNGDKNTSIYFIQSSTRNICWTPIGAAYIPGNLFEVYTIDEFYTAFPYKVGNEVVFCSEGYHGAIKKISWNGFHKRIEYSFDEKYWYTAKELKLYKNNNNNIMEKEKINIAELLKDCPEGMELDCTMYDDTFFYEITDDTIFPIRIKRIDGGSITLTKYGQYTNADYAKCVIFPKGKTTWEGFVPPCKFKDGDILISASGNPFIFKESHYNKICESYCGIRQNGDFEIESNHWTSNYNLRLATEEEKQKLFDAIKANGYCWNAETKTLEKLIEPIFKVGDKISLKCEDIYWDIKTIEGDWYICTNGAKIHIGEQHHYELVPVVSSTKFDITTLVPFESKVLVRSSKENLWKPAIFGYYLESACYPYYVLGGTCWNQCIPYEENKHLLGTTNDCDDYYKTWIKTN